MPIQKGDDEKKLWSIPYMQFSAGVLKKKKDTDLYVPYENFSKIYC